MKISQEASAEEALITEYLDTLGLACPLPLLKMKLVLNNMQSGECIQVVSSDSGSLKDFHSFCQLSGNRLLKSETQQNSYLFVIEKR